MTKDEDYKIRSELFNSICRNPLHDATRTKYNPENLYMSDIDDEENNKEEFIRLKFRNRHNDIDDKPSKDLELDKFIRAHGAIMDDIGFTGIYRPSKEFDLKKPIKHSKVHVDVESKKPIKHSKVFNFDDDKAKLSKAFDVNDDFKKHEDDKIEPLVPYPSEESEDEKEVVIIPNYNKDKVTFTIFFMAISFLHGLWTWLDTTHWSVYGRLELVYYPPVICLILADHPEKYIFATMFSLLYWLFIVVITIIYSFEI
jgi:hypothetical protein